MARRLFRQARPARRPHYAGRHVRDRGVRRRAVGSRRRVDGLRRLEYRGYDSAGVALVTGGELFTEKRAGKLANLDAALADDKPPAVDDRYRSHPMGHPRRAQRPQRPPAPRARVPRRGRAQRHHRELRVAALPSSSAAGHELRLRHRHRGRGPPARGRGGPGRRPDDSDAERMPATRRRVHAGRDESRPARHRWWRPGATRPWSSASARARTSSPPTSRPSSSTPARRWSSARTRSSRSPATAYSVTDFRGNAADGKRFHVDWDIAAAEKAGYDYFMLKEIAEQPQAIADTLLGRITSDGRLQLDEMRLSDDELRADRQDHHHRVRHGLPRRSRGEVRDRALDPHPLRGRARVGVPLPRPDHRPRHDGDRDQPERRDHGHADGAAACARAAGEGAGDLQHATARRSRASPTPCSTRTPGPRSPSHPRRRS